MTKEHSGISNFGSIAIIGSTIIGAAIAMLPASVANAGILPSAIIMVVLWLFCTLAASMLAAAVASIPGNDGFAHHIEFVGAARFYFGERMYRVTAILLSIGFIMANAVAIVQSSSVLNQLIADVQGDVCGIGFAFPPYVVCHGDPVLPDARFCGKFTDSTTCLSDQALGCNWGPGTRFGMVTKKLGCHPDSRTLWGRHIPIVLTQGFFVVVIFCIPLGMSNLEDNVVVQKIGFVGTLSVFAVWVIGFYHEFAYENPKSYEHDAPLVGEGVGVASLVGVMLYNICFAHFLPSWLNEKRPSVSANRVIWWSSGICLICSLFVGIGGALAYGHQFKTGRSADILEAVAFTNRDTSLIMKVTKWSVYLFPILVVLPGIPVSCVMLKNNFVQCGWKSDVSTVLSIALPFCIALLFQSYHSLLDSIVAWASIFVLSVVDILLPLALYYCYLKWRLESNLTPKLLRHPTATSLFDTPMTQLQVTPPQPHDHSDADTEDSETTRLNDPKRQLKRYDSVLLARAHAPQIAETHEVIPEAWMSLEKQMLACKAMLALFTVLIAAAISSLWMSPSD